MYRGRERRALPRLGAHPHTCCRLTIDNVITFRALAVENVSRSGVRLRVGLPVPVGTALYALLEDPTRGVSCCRRVRVVCCVEERRRECVLGGRFDLGISRRELEDLTETAVAQPLFCDLDPAAMPQGSHQAAQEAAGHLPVGGSR
jgi:hypothetical protein